MKLLLAFAFLAVASAAQIQVQPLVLPEPKLPEVYQALGAQQVEVVDTAPADSEDIHAVNFVDAPINEESNINVQPVQIVDGPLLDADNFGVNLVDTPIDEESPIDGPLFIVEDAAFYRQVLPEAQVDPVIIINRAPNPMLPEYRRDLPVYDNPMLR